MAQNRIFLSLGNLPCFHSPKKIRLSEFVDSYLSYKGRIGATEHTISGVRTALKCLLGYRGDVKMSGINSDYCEGFLQYLRNFHTSGGKILSQNTALAYFKSINAAFNYAARHKIISSNPFCGIDKEARINPKRTEREFLTAQEIRAMIEAKCPNKEVKAAFLFSCFCGLRISDVRNLRWEDLSENGWGGALCEHCGVQNRAAPACSIIFLCYAFPASCGHRTYFLPPVWCYDIKSHCCVGCRCRSKEAHHLPLCPTQLCHPDALLRSRYLYCLQIAGTQQRDSHPGVRQSDGRA